MEIKVILSLLVPGTKLYSEKECKINPKISYNKEKFTLNYSEGKKRKQEVITVVTRKPKPITQHINLCKEAYDYMISTSTDGISPKTWKKMSVNEKLKAHFDLIMHDLRAVSYNFEILDN